MTTLSFSKPVENADLVVLSLGAGVQSSTLALMAAREEISPMPDCAIFADTGWEPKQVYEFLDNLEMKLPFPVYRVSAGNLRDDSLANRNSPGQRFASAPFYTKSPNGVGMLRRQCTREYKIEPVQKKIRELLGLEPRQRAAGKYKVEQWIGISTDEIVRLRDSGKKWLINRWPLIEEDMSRQNCLKWWASSRQNMTPTKSSCIGCPMHNDAAWRDMRDNDPESWADAIEFDKAIRPGLRNTTEKLFLHQTAKPLDQADISNAEDKGQISFLDECEGMCGV